MSTKTTDTNTPSGPYTVEEAPLEYSATHRWRVTGPSLISDAVDRSEAAYALCSQLNAAYQAGQKSMVKMEVGLNEEDVMAVYLAHENYFNLHEGTPAKRSGNFRARIKNALKLKADIASAPPTDNT